MYVVKVVGVTKYSNDRSNTSPSADETPKTNNPGTRWRDRCSSVTQPATNPCGKMRKSSLNDALSRDERIPDRHCE